MKLKQMKLKQHLKHYKQEYPNKRKKVTLHDFEF